MRVCSRERPPYLWEEEEGEHANGHQDKRQDQHAWTKVAAHGHISRNERKAHGHDRVSTEVDVLCFVEILRDFPRLHSVIGTCH